MEPMEKEQADFETLNTISKMKKTESLKLNLMDSVKQIRHS